MTTLKTLGVPRPVACWMSLVLLSGCAGESKDLTGAATTQPAPTPRAGASDADVKALPAKALVPLAELKPKISPPAVGKPSGKRPPRVERDVQEAQKLLAQKKPAAAIDLLERAVGFVPTHGPTRRLLGKAYLALPNRGKALTNLKAAAAATPDDLETHLLLGQLAATQQQHGQAIGHLRTALACSGARPEEPLAAEALLTLSLLLDRDGYWTAALDAYVRLAEWIEKHARDYADRPALREWALRPERLLSRRGALLLLLHQNARAVQLLDRAYRRDRTNGRTAKLLFDALLADNQPGRMETLLAEMAHRPTQRTIVPRLLEELCRHTQDKALPMRFWQATRAKHDADPAIALALAKVSGELGWNDTSFAILRDVLASSPTDEGLWRMLCKSYARRGQYEDLFPIIAETVSADPNTMAPIGVGLSASAASVKTDGLERRFAERARKSTSPAQHALLYLAGRVASARGKHILAADLYQRAAERKKGFFKAYEALLEAYTAQKRQDRVDRLLDRIESLARNTHFPAYFRGKVALGRGDAAAAVDALKQALKRNANDLPTELLLAQAYLAAGQIDNAIGALEATCRQHPTGTDAPRRLFDLYLLRRRFRDARDLAVRILRRDRRSTTGRLMMAELALRAGRRDEALLLLRQLSSEAPDDVAIRLVSVRALLGTTPGLVSKKEFDEASESLSRVLRTDPESLSARQALAELLAAVDKTAEAAGIWATVFDDKPDNTEFMRKYVVALIRTEQHGEALRAVERFRKNHADDLWARVRLLELLGELKRFDEVQKAADPWVRDAKDENIKTLFRQELLRVLRLGEQFAKALAIVDQWIAEAPPRARRRQLEYTRIHLLNRLERHDEAAKLVERLRDADPLSDAERILVASCAETKQFDRALKLLDRWIDQGLDRTKNLQAAKRAVENLAKSKATSSPAHAAATRKLPAALEPQVSQALAGRQYKQATAKIDLWAEALVKSVDDLRGLRIILCGEAKQLGRARHLAEEWIRDEPRALAPRKALAGLLAEANAFDQAEKLVTKWLQQTTATTSATQPAEPDETVSWLREMSIRLQLLRQKYDQALQTAEACRKLEPKNTEFLALQSACLTELGRDDEALTVMEAAHALLANDPSLCNNLGYMYAERGIHLDKAEKMLRKALAGRPGETAFRDSLAWVLYKRGQLREAGREFQRILRDHDDEETAHGVILDHAGDSYYRLGWKKQAVAFWKQALALGKKIERPTREEKQLLTDAAAKLKAVEAGRQPPLAPLGLPTEPPSPDKTPKKGAR